MPENPAPIFIKLTRTVEGVTWGYCKGRPLIHPNGLVEVPPNDNSMVIDSEVFHLDCKKQPDFAFFIMYKSGLLGTEYMVYDPEGDKLKELTEKNARLKVQSSIREFEEEKLRMLSQAWGVKEAGTKNMILLQEELENKVFSMDDAKKKDPTKLMLKGIAEFLAESKNDAVTRPKALIQQGIDDKVITFNHSDSNYYFNGNKLCYVPFNTTERQDYLAQYLRNPENSEKWLDILKALVTKETIEKYDKYGIRWIAEQLGLALNKKEDVLRTELLEMFA
jgi:hypothetical protein